MIYYSNEQLVTELKKLFLDNKCSQRDIAKKMGISPQAFQNLLNKKQLSFADIKRVLECMDCDLLVDFSMRTTPQYTDIYRPTARESKAKEGITKSDEKPAAAQEPPAAGPKEPERQQAPEPEQQAASAPRQRQAQYRRFTEAEAAQIDLSRLLTDGRYQMQIAGDFGIDVLNTLAAKAKQQASTPDPDATPEK